MALSLKGNENDTLVMRYRVDAGSAEIPGVITGDVSVAIAACDLLETYDQTQMICACVLNAERETASNVSSTCLCLPGYTAINNQLSCGACAPGTYTDTRGTSCQNCPFNFVAPLAASTVCTVCPSNSNSYSSTACGAACRHTIIVP